jgi:hypothetical protein
MTARTCSHVSHDPVRIFSSVFAVSTTAHAANDQMVVAAGIFAQSWVKEVDTICAMPVVSDRSGKKWKEVPGWGRVTMTPP